jgi:hypothetical protein
MKQKMMVVIGAVGLLLFAAGPAASAQEGSGVDVVGSGAGGGLEAAGLGELGDAEHGLGRHHPRRVGLVAQQHRLAHRVALADVAFALEGVSGTTDAVTPLVIVNGPIRARLDVNSAASVFGAGWRANTAGASTTTRIADSSAARFVMLPPGSHEADPRGSCADRPWICNNAKRDTWSRGGDGGPFHRRPPLGLPHFSNISI